MNTRNFHHFNFVRKETLTQINCLFQIQLWDTAGLERAGRMTSNYYNFSHAVILMYDVTDTTTMNNLEMWYDNAKNDSNNTNTIYFLVGNKIDETPGEIQVSEGEARKFAKDSLKITSDEFDTTYRISAKTGDGLNDLFLKITHILSGCSKQPAEKLDNTITDLADGGKDKEKCSC